MSVYIQNQIFFDRTERRWLYLRTGIYFLGLIFVVLFGTMFFSMLRKPALPKPKLPAPRSSLRAASGTVSVNKNMQSTVAAKNSMAPLGENQTLAPAQSLMTSVPASPLSSKSAAKTKIVGFYVNWDDTSYTSLQNNISELDLLIPEWLHLADENGSLSIDNQTVQDNTLKFILQNHPNLPITPLVNNFNQEKQAWDSERIERMLINPQARARTIQNLLDFVNMNNFAGISIDFENIPEANQPMLVQFMKEIYAEFHPLGLEVTLNVPLDDDAFDYKALASWSDYLILMAYDEHSVESDAPGPVASQNWFVNSMNSRIKDISAEKFIVALGNYGYDWEGITTKGKTYTFQEAMLSANVSGSQVYFDRNSMNPTYDYWDGDVRHHVWFLDGATTFNQISALKDFPVHGFALWRMGSEDPSVWQVFSKRKDLNSEVAKSLIVVDYGYDINYEGHGEILRVTGTPAKGMRNLTFDKKTGMIIKEDFPRYPSAYTIYRWGEQDSKKIALTFDDGPDRVYTSEILSVLKQHEAKATFFIVGVNGVQNQDILREMAANGNEIGSHTFTHPNVTGISNSQFAFELNSTQSLLASVIGRHTLLFRPPYAEDIEPVTPDQIRPVLFATDRGYFTVSMHIDPKDWNSPGVNEIVNRVVESATRGDGNIVLLHDGGGDRSQTVAALPKIIKGLRARGFEIVTVSDLMALPQDSVMPAVASGSHMLSEISAGGYIATDWGTGFLSRFFVIGIILGLLRYFVVAMYAIAQKIRQYFEKYPDYQGRFKPSVAVVIPALNEEKVIRKTISSILRSTYSNFEIIFVDDGSTDSTLNVVNYFFAKNPKVKIYAQANRGKWAALNFGIEKTRAQILITLDADTIFRPSTIGRLIPYFSDLQLGAVAGNTKVGNRKNFLTRWQALEYITSQNLDRRAFDILNCITVVPGSVGAWRRKAVIEAGGFSGKTLAEDADLTFSIIRLGYRVVFQARAIAYTEAPDNISDFIKQRFRWMLGTFQAAWKHVDAMFRPRYGALGFFALPNIFVFQILFPLISPLMDLTILFSLAWAIWQGLHHPVDYSSYFAIQKLFKYYLLFLAVDFATSATAFVLEKSEDWKLLFWLIPQRFFYRQLIYIVAIKVLISALKGKIVGWGKLRRKATVSYGN